MIGDFFKAVGQLGDPRFRKVFGISIALTLLLLAGLYAAWWWLSGGIDAAEGTTLLGFQLGFLDTVLEVLARIGGVIVLFFLMMPVASLFIGLFLEEIADAVEARHYPDARGTRKIGWAEMAWDGVLFTLTLIGVNLLALILYVIFLPAGPFIFLAVNGWLLGRQYFELVAARHVGFKEARVLRKRFQAPVFIAGVLMAAPLSIPIVGLVVPVLGVATFTHMHQRLTHGRRAAAA
ncbi:EI24 domain-containing protein [Rhodovulum sp. DZ06]|uniref:EI24 domain-containing protein n=1 Tax=Rhodovulum sp. DZ06 TaxID=3425126 RepID=UPI003D32EA4D